MLKRVMILLVAIFPVVVMAQFFDPTLSDWDSLLVTVKSYDHSSIGAVCVVISQALFLLFRTIAGRVLGMYQLLVLAILNTIVCVGVKLISGASLGESFIYDSSVLLSYQIAASQIYIQWKKRYVDRASLPGYHDCGNGDDVDSGMRS